MYNIFNHEDQWICGHSEDRKWLDENQIYVQDHDDEDFDEVDDSLSGVQVCEVVKSQVVRFIGHDDM